ncbi:hypothetical protein LSH36_17g04000 [Paralvinella palmiformis]|uniref:Uncharacterized protein n=1 Tax=Paralvinella palmiformis TaxID=53620 RepID=A0AAD9KBP3_9ANNE|nr:hypothetical protein LSH36_17g04000 [Paralvinella palmiformis]
MPGAMATSLSPVPDSRFSPPSTRARSPSPDRTKPKPEKSPNKMRTPEMVTGGWKSRARSRNKKEKEEEVELSPMQRRPKPSEGYEAPVSGREKWWRDTIRETPIPGRYEHSDLVRELRTKKNTYRFKSDGRKMEAQPYIGRGKYLLPGAYEHEDLEKRMAKFSETYGFKNTSRESRDMMLFGKKDKDINVPPNAYNVNTYLAIHAEKCPSKHWTFKSTSARFPTVQFKPKEGPPPGGYDYRPAETLHTISSSFVSRTPRFSTSHTKTPGPGSYDRMYKPMTETITKMGRLHGIFLTPRLDSRGRLIKRRGQRLFHVDWTTGFLLVTLTFSSSTRDIMANEEVEDPVHCEACLCTNTSIKQLPCKHAFCMTCLCLNRVSMTAQPLTRNITCPMCDEEHYLPEGGIPALPTFKTVGKMTCALKEYQRQTSRGTLQCTLCSDGSPSEKKPAKLYCITCYELLCHRCAGYHNAMPTSREHVTVPIDDDTTDALFCLEHGTRLVRSFCMDDVRLICNVCAQASHKDHVLVDLVRGDHSVSGDRETIYRSLDRIFRDLQAKRERLENFKKRSKEKLMQTKKEITVQLWHQMEIIQRRLQDQERLLHEQIDEQYQTIEKHCSEVGKQIEKAIGSVTKLQMSANAILKPFGDVAEITSAKFPVEWFQDRFTKIPMPSADPDWCLSVVGRFNPSNEIDLGHVDKMAMAKSGFDDRDSFQVEPQLLWELNADDVVDVSFINDRCPGIVYSSFKSTSAGGEFVIKKLGDAGTSVDLTVPIPSSSEQFCAIGANFLGTQCVVLTKGTRGSWDVVIMQKDTVTCSTLSNNIPPKGDPVAIAINASGDIVVATLENPERKRGSTSLRCYHRDGYVLWCRTTTPGDVRSQGNSTRLNTPWSICVDSLDRILVADAAQGCVKIYNNLGIHLETFYPDFKRGGRPVAVCTNELAEIYVAFYDDRLVSKFTANGQFMRHILKTGSRPKAIGIDSDRLVVATSRALRLYQLGGE